MFGRTYSLFKYETKIHRKYKLRDDGCNKWTILSGINYPGGEELLVVAELTKKIPNFLETKRLITVTPVLKYLKWISTFKIHLNPFQTNCSANRILPSSYLFWAVKRLVDYM
jgi:hypothetical protein